MPPKKMKIPEEKIEYMNVPLKPGYRYASENEAILANKVLLWGKYTIKKAKLELNKDHLHPPKRITRAKEFRREHLLAGVDIKPRMKKEKDKSKSFDPNADYEIDDIPLLEKFYDDVTKQIEDMYENDKDASKLEDIQEAIHDNLERLEGIAKMSGQSVNRDPIKLTIPPKIKGGAFEEEHGLGNLEQPYFYWYFGQLPKLARTKFRDATAEEAINNNMVSLYGVKKIPSELETRGKTIGHAGNINNMTRAQLQLLGTSQKAKRTKGRKEFELLAFRRNNNSDEKYEEELAEKMNEIIKNDQEYTHFLMRIQNKINKIDGKPIIKKIMYEPLSYKKIVHSYTSPKQETYIEKEDIKEVTPMKQEKIKKLHVFANDTEELRIPESHFNKEGKLKTSSALKLKLMNKFLHPEHYQDKDIGQHFYSKMGTIEGNGIGGKIHASNFFNKVGSTLSNVGHKIESGLQTAGNKIESGLTSAYNYADKVINGTDDYLPPVREIIKKYANNTITGVTVGRAPVPGAITGALNVVSAGTFKEGMNTQPYDKLFHLFLYLTLNDGTKLLFEKNATINSAVNSQLPPDTETRLITPPNNTTTLQTFLQNGQNQMGDKYFVYDPHYNNCQDYILGLLVGNGWGTQDDYHWIKQDTGQLFANNKYLGTVARGVTNFGGIIDRAIKGVGIHKPLNKKNSHIQSILFKCPEWKQSQAKEWLKENKFKGLEVDVKPNHLRYRQEDPDENKYDYRTIKAGSNIEFIVGIKR